MAILVAVVNGQNTIVLGLWRSAADGTNVVLRCQQFIILHRRQAVRLQKFLLSYPPTVLSAPLPRLGIDAFFVFFAVRDDIC